MSFSSPATAAEHYQRIGKARQQQRRANGLCSTCSRPAVRKADGTPMSRCQVCREASTKASRRYIARNRAQCKTASLHRRARYAAAGLCGCGKPIAEGYRACLSCRGRNRDAARKYAASKRWRYRDAGLCLRCDRETGTNRATGQPYRHCLWHRLAQAKAAKLRRLAKVAA